MIKTLRQFADQYCGDAEHFTHVKDAEIIRTMASSKASCCWGCGPVGSTGWVTLSQPSRRTKGELRQIFVCRQSEYDAATKGPKE